MLEVIDLMSSDEETSPTKSATNALAGFHPRKQKVDSRNLRNAIQNAQQPPRPKDNNFPRTSTNGGHAPIAGKHGTTQLPAPSNATSSTATPISGDRRNTPSLAELLRQNSVQRESLQKDAKDFVGKNGWRKERSPSPPAEQAPPVRKANKAKRSSVTDSLQRAEKAQAVQAREKAKRDDRVSPKENGVRRNEALDRMRDPLAGLSSLERKPSQSQEGNTEQTQKASKRDTSPAAQTLQPSLKRKREETEPQSAKFRGSSEAERRRAPSTIHELLPRPRKSVDLEEESDDDSEDVPDMIPARPVRRTQNVIAGDGLPAQIPMANQGTTTKPIQPNGISAIEQPWTSTTPAERSGTGSGRLRKSREQKRAERNNAARAQTLLDAGEALPPISPQDRQRYERYSDFGVPQLGKGSGTPNGVTLHAFDTRTTGVIATAGSISNSTVSRPTPPVTGTASSDTPATLYGLVQHPAAATAREASIHKVPTLNPSGALNSAGPSLAGQASSHGSKWTEDEDIILLHLKQDSQVKWDDMPLYFQGRTRASLKFRYGSLKDKSEVREIGHNSRWTAEEDAQLINLKQDSSLRWDDIPQYFCDRTQGALKARYSTLMKDNPEIMLGTRWTTAEDARLLDLRQGDVKVGWDNMSQHFPGCTRAALKSRYLSLTKEAGQSERQDRDETDGTGLHLRWTAEEDAQLLRLRQDPKTRWKHMPQYFQGRTRDSLKTRYLNLQKNTRDTEGSGPGSRHTEEEDAPPSPIEETIEIKAGSLGAILTADRELLTESKQGRDGVGECGPDLGHPAEDEVSSGLKEDKSEAKAGGFGSRYTAEEDALLTYLKQDAKVRWEDMPRHFQGRTQGSLQVRYSALKKAVNSARQVGAVPSAVATLPRTETSGSDIAEYPPHARRRHKSGARNDGFVTWAEVRAKRLDSDDDKDTMDVDSPTAGPIEAIQLPAEGLTARDVAHPSSLSRVLRAREMGSNGGRGRHTSIKVSDELKSHVLDSLGPHRLFNGTSRDVTCVAWAPDGNRFAAGSIAISDPTSMQYNRPYNLLLGDVKQNSLLELPEHHVERPIITDSRNVNSSHGMQETQDPRLFMTVAAVEFSKDGQRLFTGGSDCVSRVYDANNGKCLDAFTHAATVDLISWNNNGILATACHRSDDEAIRVIKCKRSRFSAHSSLKPIRTTATPVFPTSLKWGVAPAHRRYLLAGFSSDTYDTDNTAAGEICLWDVESGGSMPMMGSSRNVFDVAWNPSPGSGSSVFAVASAKAGRRMRSVVQCFGMVSQGLRSIIEWESPAYDINDVVYCPHDYNLIAAGATDGYVYLWDKRFARRNQAPLHVFRHGETKNVLDHDRDREAADTGVRFLSWSATANRLYSASSDGVVKVWNPYRTTEDALVKNVATFKSAVMSGAFSPDYRDLLIGEDQGQLNLLSIDREGRSVHAAKRFNLHTAKLKETTPEDKFDAARELVDARQIEFQTMGDLPKRQAVQGPNYSGPFMKPSSDHFDWLTNEYEAAEAGLQETRQQAESMLTQDSDTGKAVREAEARFSSVKDAWAKAARRRLDFYELEPNAKRLQVEFLAAEADAGSSLERAKRRCRLDCGYLPAAGDDDGEAPDDRYSEQRVPGALRAQRKVLDCSGLTNEEVIEAGLTGKCSACNGPAAQGRKGMAPLCPKCSLTRSGLTARCANCALPVRPRVNSSSEPNLCQRCDFRCFRCGVAADLALRADMLQCESCGLAWEVGVLGYELKTRVGDEVEKVKRLRRNDGDEFGEEEMERLAAAWSVPLVDGTQSP